MSFHGKFCWYELMTTDAKAAESFYRAVVGWNAKDAGMPDFAYTLLSAGETQIGGMMNIPGEAKGMPPVWFGYIAVDDVDEYAEKVKAEGGTVHKPPADIPNVGRFAMVADPQGVHFVLFKGTGVTPPAPAPGTPGHIGWDELFTDDREGGFAFYAKLFGWTKGDAMDMGPMGVYQLFNIDGQMSGGMMTRPPDLPKSFWLYYFNVGDIDEAVTRVNDAGGKVIMGPHEVPGPMWILQGFDPQGAMFALVGTRKA